LSQIVHIVARTDSTARYVGVEIILTVLVTHTLIVVEVSRNHNLDFSTKDQCETISTNRLFNTGKTGVVPPVIQFTSKSIGFKFEQAKFAGGDETMSAGSMNVSY